MFDIQKKTKLVKVPRTLWNVYIPMRLAKIKLFDIHRFYFFYLYISALLG